MMFNQHSSTRTRLLDIYLIWCLGKPWGLSYLLNLYAGVKVLSSGLSMDGSGWGLRWNWTTGLGRLSDWNKFLLFGYWLNWYIYIWYIYIYHIYIYHIYIAYIYISYIYIYIISYIYTSIYEHSGGTATLWPWPAPQAPDGFDDPKRGVSQRWPEINGS